MKTGIRPFDLAQETPPATANNMRVIVFGLALCAFVFAFSVTIGARELRKVPRIGILEPATAASVSARVDAFRQRLRGLGYIEGQTIAIEYRYADGKPERLPD